MISRNDFQNGRSSRRWLPLAFGATLVICGCQSMAKSPSPTATVSRPAAESPVRRVSHDELAEPVPGSSHAQLSDSPTPADPVVCPQPCFRGCPATPGIGAGMCAPGCVPGQPPLWSPNEYVCDGGDAFPAVDVAQDWRVFGLGAEDTVAHYDTLDGRTCVQPSNRVCLYAPRFAAVRKVAGIVQHEQNEFSAGLARPEGPVLSGTAELATTLLQPEQPRGEQSVSAGQMFRERNRTVGLDNRQALATARHDLLPFEDFLALQRGQLDDSQKARLAARLEAAIVWTHAQAVQVVIDNVQAVEASANLETESVYTYEMPKGKPRLCLAKCASTGSAKPGDIVEFTIRFQNVGDQRIGNVTILDNLSSRLEFVEGSDQCSLKAKFSSSENEGESLVLRWEVTDPLEVGEGGVIHFNCRVR